MLRIAACAVLSLVAAVPDDIVPPAAPPAKQPPAAPSGPADAPASKPNAQPVPLSQLDALTGGAFTAPTSGERAARLREKGAERLILRLDRHVGTQAMALVEAAYDSSRSPAHPIRKAPDA